MYSTEEELSWILFDKANFHNFQENYWKLHGSYHMLEDLIFVKMTHWFPFVVVDRNFLRPFFGLWPNEERRMRKVLKICGQSAQWATVCNWNIVWFIILMDFRI